LEERFWQLFMVQTENKIKDKDLTARAVSSKLLNRERRGKR
jgi:hypothetical protein